MNLVEKNVGDKSIIQVNGDISYNDVQEFKKQIIDILNKLSNDVILDLSSTKYISLKGLETLADAYRMIESKNKILIAMKPSQEIKSILETLSLGDSLYFAETLSVAMSLKPKDSVEAADNDLPSAKEDSSSANDNEAIDEKSENEVCENWKKKSFFDVFQGKRCGTCKFFQRKSDGKGGRCTL